MHVVSVFLSVGNIRCISKHSIKFNVWSIVWYCIHSKIIPEFVT